MLLLNVYYFSSRKVSLLFRCKKITLAKSLLKRFALQLGSGIFFSVLLAFRTEHAGHELLYPVHDVGEVRRHLQLGGVLIVI